MCKSKNAHQYAIALLGVAISSFGLYNIHAQCGVTEGGVLGATLLLRHWFGISPAISEFVMDVICYALGYKYLGKAFLRCSIVATCGFSFFYGIYEQFPPLLPNFSDQPLIAAILGALFVGVGVGLVVRIGGAAGGDDALALVISKLSKQPIARAYLFTDVVVLVLSLSYIPLRQIAFSLVTVTISSYVIGFVQNFGKQTEDSGAAPKLSQAMQ